MTPPIISLAPLSVQDHAAALQAVYQATPHFWEMYGLLATPAGQAARDLQEAAQTPNRYILGIIRRINPDDAAAGGELIGTVDFRLNWPDRGVAYIGMLMVAEPYQRQGVGLQAWRLLAPWLSQTAGIETARLGVEQFNPGALHFFQTAGFTLTGGSRRISVGSKWVRLLYMEQPLEPSPSHSPHSSGGESA